ncbi:nucleotide modification associated domain-containing protein [Blattabacterium cuenoti]|uniref:nucleotide modification associated domain-containing protein n=1 Tax=Blattabacterium cuenoti TaxID=1653831 RepID=UPI00163C1FD0|nr:nucleotide modification associated domain-containing protein [Blattabacterium cuenoti]
MNYNYIYFFIKRCKKIFFYKLESYGLSWKILKNHSIIDQIFIKIIRIRNISLKGFYHVKGENILDTYIDIINYLLIALIKLDVFYIKNNKISNYDVINFYEKNIRNTLNIINNMNFCINSDINILIKKILDLKENLDRLSNKKLKKIYFEILIYTIFLIKKTINNSCNKM